MIFRSERYLLVVAFLRALKAPATAPLRLQKKVLVSRFASSVLDFSITRASQTLRGNMKIQLLGDDNLIVSFLLPDFKDESLGITQGTTTIRGLMGTGK